MSTEIVKAKKTTGSVAGNWEEISRNYAIPIFLGLLKASILLLKDVFTIDMTDVDYNIVVL